VTGEVQARAEQLDRASARIADALASLQQPEDLGRAGTLIEEALGLNPALERAWIARGLLHARRGLGAPLADKSAHATAALADLLRAHLVAGGQPLPGVWVEPTAGPVGTGSGSPIALWTLTDLLLLLPGREEEAQAALTALHALPDGFDLARLKPMPIYDWRNEPRRAPEDIAYTPELARARPNRDAVIRQLVRGPITTLNPLRANEYAPLVAELLFESLFVFDSSLSCMPNPHLIAVNGCRQAEDKLTWTVTLREGLRWHDGESITSRDLVFSWECVRDSRPDIADAVADGPLRVHFKLCKAMTEQQARDAMRFYVVPRHLAGDDNSEESLLRLFMAMEQHPIGSGPFLFKDRDGSERVELVRWDEYEPRPLYAGMVFEYVRDPLRRAQELARGAAHAAELSAVDFRWLINGTSFDVFKLGDERKLEYDYICWNFNDNPFFADPRVRQAMTHALDLEALRDLLSGGLFVPCYGPFPREAWMGNPTIELLQYKPDEANRLLSLAGWEVDPAGGARRRGQERFAFSLLTPEDGFSRAVGLLVQRQLAQVGVAVTVDPQPFAGAYKIRRDTRKFAGMLSSVRSIGHPAGAKDHFTPEGKRNYGSYRSDSAVNLFDEARAAADGEEERRKYRELHARIYEDQPYTFLWQKRALWAFNKRVRGVKSSPLGPVGFYPGQRGWWVLSESD
jgi:peptide/nickel transport system substrate-binding protein